MSKVDRQAADLGFRATVARRPVHPPRWPWGTTTVATAGTAAWWTSVAVPRAAAAPGDLLDLGSAVPVTGPAARDTDGDGVPDTLVLAGPDGTTFWSDLDGDGLADRVGPAEALLGALADHPG